METRQIGVAHDLVRYPVKSMQGERLQTGTSVFRVSWKTMPTHYVCRMVVSRPPRSGPLWLA